MRSGLQKCCPPHPLVHRVLWTRAIHLKPFVYAPFVVDAEAGQSGDGVSLLHLIQTDGALARVSGEDVLVVGEACFAEAHEQMLLYLLCSHKLGAHRTVETSQQVRVELSRQGANEQPVALGGDLVVTICAIHALAEYMRACSAWYAESGAHSTSSCVSDPRAVRAVCVSQTSDPSPAAGAARRKIGAGVSPSPAIENWAALFAPHVGSLCPPSLSDI